MKTEPSHETVAASKAEFSYPRTWAELQATAGHHLHPEPSALRDAVVDGNPQSTIELTGSYSAARKVAAFVAALRNCVAQGDGEPCGECESCRETLPSGGIAVLRLTAEESAAFIRRAAQHLRRRGAGPWEVVLVPAEVVDRSSALRAAMKSPPPKTAFVVVTTES
jgi:hypothetical protein